MALVAFALAWYVALIALLVNAVWRAYGRKAATEGQDQAYDARRFAERSRHLARVREEEWDLQRRRELRHV